MEAQQFIAKWHASELNERSAAQEHFIDLCRLLDEPTPAEDDPSGQRYCFERGARKDTGGRGWADVWKRHCFAWEYKGKHKNLDAAFNQLRQYALALENPPLLIVSDMARFRIHTNWTNSVSVVHEFALDDLADAAVRDKTQVGHVRPRAVAPGREPSGPHRAGCHRLCGAGAGPADARPRPAGSRPFRQPPRLLHVRRGCRPAAQRHVHAHVGTRPHSSRRLRRDGTRPLRSDGRWRPRRFETVAWFNGGLFDNDDALPLERTEIETTLQAAALDWSEIDPSILGTLFERGLDPGKRSQLGAHYTDRDKIMQIIEPVVTRPLLKEWEKARAEIGLRLERADVASTGAARTRQRGHAERTLREFLEKLRAFTVLDPACGSGNFLYLALHALKDLEHRVQLEAESLGLQRAFPAVSPANVKGIEINPYAAELARVSVWIGEIQWMRRNGFSGARDPILDPLDTIECRDAILNPDGPEPDWPRSRCGDRQPPVSWRQAAAKLVGRGVC